VEYDAVDVAGCVVLVGVDEDVTTGDGKVTVVPLAVAVPVTPG